MKYLKLDARFEECHGLARALVGSLVDYKKDNDEDCFFRGIRKQIIQWSFVTDISGGETQLLLPLDTLKLCPFVAFKERIKVKAKRFSPDQREWSESVEINKNTIDSIRFNYGFCDFAISNDYELGFWFSKSRFELDLDKLPKGAEIVEI